MSRPHRPQPWSNRQLAVGGLAAILFFAVLFTVVAMSGWQPGDGGTVVPDDNPGVEVDIDHHHRVQPRHSAQERQRQGGKATATPRTTSSPKVVR